MPGNPSRGRARQLTSTDGTIKKGVKKVKEIAERLEIVTMQMDALAGELRRLGNDPEKREQIVKQIVQLGKLYLTVRAETDLSLQDR